MTKLNVELNFLSGLYEVVDNSMEGFRNVLKSFDSKESADSYLLSIRFTFCL